MLEVGDLSIRLRNGSAWVPMVEALNIAIPAGQSLAIVGESGAGKSLTARALMGLLPRSFEVSGSMKLDGIAVDLSSEAAHARLRGHSTFMILQDAATSLNPSMTIRTQLMEAANRPHVRQRVGAQNIAALCESTLEEVGLVPAPTWLARYPHELSGGMRQRVVIAMALIIQPKLLIADEPTSALDILSQHAVLRLLSELQKKHRLTVLFISHDFRAVARLCDRAAIMLSGRLVEEASVTQVLQKPVHPYSKLLIGSIPALHRKTLDSAAVGFAEPPPISARGIGCPFSHRCGNAIAKCREAFPPFQGGPQRGGFACWNPIREAACIPV